MKNVKINSEAKLVFLSGIPDAGFKSISVNSNGDSLSITFAGTANFINYVPQAIRSNPIVYLPLEKNLALDIPPVPFVNHMADPDFYNIPLMQANNIVGALKQPCFNHPLAVWKNNRDKMSAKLSRISGLIVPRCVKIKPKKIDDFSHFVKIYDLKYPLIVRLSGTHGGKTQTLIKGADFWNDVFSIPWIDADVYLTEFYNYQDNDGYFRKQRVAVVGNSILPRHGCANHSWLVTGFNSPPETLQAELAWNEKFETQVLPIIKDRIFKITNAIDLDYYGIDYSLRPNGDILIFEVSASMSMLSPYNDSTHREIEDFPIKIKNCLADLLMKPEKWRCNKGNK